MRISDLLRYRNDIRSAADRIDLTLAISEVCQQLHQLTVTYPFGIVNETVAAIKSEYETISVNSDSLRGQLAALLPNIDIAVDALAKELHTHNVIDFFNFYHRTEFQINEDTLDIIKGHIYQNAHHHYAGLQFGCTPQSKALTGELVANDPLYLCDTSSDKVEDIAGQFNEVYYGRLRKYTITDHNLSVLPQNQFGFIFSWMLFNYANVTCIHEYLKKMSGLLRPGGRFIFSYNNCDLLESCVLAETGGMSYVSNRQLIALCLQEGFEIVHEYDLPNNDDHVKWISWIEIKKPGELSTVKRRQVLGEIKQK